MRVNSLVFVLEGLVAAAFAYVQQGNFNNLPNFQGARPTTPYLVKPGYYAPDYSPTTEMPELMRTNSQALQQVALVLEPSQPRHVNWDLPAAHYNQRVWHVEPQPSTQALSADYALQAATANEDQLKPRRHWVQTEEPTTGNFMPNYERLKKQPNRVKKFHDIFLQYEGPQQVRFGHVETRPALRARRFEELNKGNRYRGEVLWTDKTGGYGEHYWDLVQGNL